MSGNQDTWHPELEVNVSDMNTNPDDNNSSQLTLSHVLVDPSNPNANAYNPSNGYAQQFALPPNMHPGTVMMMHPPAMGGIIPLNVVMPPNLQLDSSESVKKPKKRRKKDKNKPKRPLSAYNLYFKDEREKILSQIPKETGVEVDKEITWPGKKRPPHGKISFEALAKTIGSRWKNLDDESRSVYKMKANEDLERYAKEMKIYDKRSKQHFKNDSDYEDDDEDDTKRPREDSKITPITDGNRKKIRKLTKDDKDESEDKNVQSMQNIVNNAVPNTMQKKIPDTNMGDIMAMNITKNYMLPMMMNPSSGQPIDELEIMKAQHRLLSELIGRETEKRRKMQQQQQGTLGQQQGSNFLNEITQNPSLGQYQAYRPGITNNLDPIAGSSTSLPNFTPFGLDQGATLHGIDNHRKPAVAANLHPQLEQVLNENNSFFPLHSNQNITDLPQFPTADDQLFGQTDQE